MLRGAVALFALAFYCAACVYTDLRTGRIPNAVPVSGFAAGILLSLPGGARSLSASVTGAALGLSILMVPFLLRMVGAGDVKFLAAAGSLVGWRALWLSFLAGAAIGGLIGLVLLLRKEGSARLRHRLLLLHAGVWHRPHRAAGGLYVGPGDLKMPYALPLSLGLLTVASLRTLVWGG